MATKPLKSWIDTLFNLMSDEELVIRKTINHHLAVTFTKRLNRDWSKNSTVVLSFDDINRRGKSYFLYQVNQIIEEVRNR